jgi:SnoaL-like domain
MTNSVPTQSAAINETRTFTRMEPPPWLLAFWKEIDDKTWGKGFDCFAEDAVAHLGVSDWRGREGIRASLRAFVDKGFTAHHDVVEYWDGGSLKVFRGFVTMNPNDPNQPAVKPAMTHFFYMDKDNSTKVARWYGSVGPTAF